MRWWRMLNAGVVPVVPEQGSVGASGDLAPLSHVALALMGEGEVARSGRRRDRAGAALAPRRARAVPVRAQGRARVHQRHAGADRAARAAGARCLGALAHRRRRGGDEPRGAAGHAGAARSSDSRGPPPPGTARGRGAHARAPARQRDSRVPPGERPPGPGRLQPALRAPGARRRGRCDPVRAGDRRGGAQRVHRQSAGLPGRRGDLGRQLPRAAGGAGARPPRHDAHDPAGHRRAAGRAARKSRSVPGIAGLPHRRTRGSRPAS